MPLIFILVYLFSIGDQPIDGLSLAAPQSIYMNKKNELYVADTGNNRILLLDSQGRFVKSVGGYGWDNEQFDVPVDISSRYNLDVFVADRDNQRVMRFDSKLNFISILVSGPVWPEHLQFGYPRAVSLSRHGDLFILDGENVRVLKLNAFGEPEISFGDYRDGPGKLNDPGQVELSGDDRVYVSDRADGRIVVYDIFGNYLMDFGKGVLQEPHGLFVDRNENLWVADPGEQRILVFDKTGVLLYDWKHITAKRMFVHPMDITLADDRAYVADGDSIHVFEIRINQSKK